MNVIGSPGATPRAWDDHLPAPGSGTGVPTSLMSGLGAASGVLSSLGRGERFEIAVNGLPGRTLGEGELAALVEAIRRRPDLWRSLVHHDPDERQCASLHAGDHVGIWVISWMPGHDTGWHDHAGSWGAVAVAAGRIREDRPPWGGSGRRLEAAAEQSFTFDHEDIHRVAAIGDDPVVTIHAYSPPLQRMGTYRVDDDGSVKRSSIRWEETLRA